MLPLLRHRGVPGHHRDDRPQRGHHRGEDVQVPQQDWDGVRQTLVRVLCNR